MHSVLGNGPRSLAVNAQDSCVSLLPDTQTVVFTDAHAIYAKGITLKHKKLKVQYFAVTLSRLAMSLNAMKPYAIIDT